MDQPEVNQGVFEPKNKAETCKLGRCLPKKKPQINLPINNKNRSLVYFMILFSSLGQDRESKDNQAWKLHELLVRNFVQKCLQLKFSDNDIRRAIGIIRTNSVKLEHREGLGEEQN